MSGLPPAIPDLPPKMSALAAQAARALRRAIAMPAAKALPIPTGAAARRRAMKARGW